MSSKIKLDIYLITQQRPREAEKRDPGNEVEHLRGISEGVTGWGGRGGCFSELQNTTYTEGIVLLIFSKDEVRRAHCQRCVRIHRPNCKATNASVLFPPFRTKFLSTVFKQLQTAAIPCNGDVLPPLSLIRDFRKQNTRGKVSEISVNHTCDNRSDRNPPITTR